jgi:cytochrome c-type biogenesis protein CcmH/NrfG
MTVNDTLVAFTLLVTMLALVVGSMAYWEFKQLRILRQELQQFQIELLQRLFRAQKAQQRIIASYGIADPARRIALLKSAIDTDPDSFNGYNALGYAYLDQNDTQAAIAAFKEATVRHPDAKEGYFDLAEAYRRLGRIDLCKAALEQAIKHDPTAKDDLANDTRFQNL